MRRIRRAFGQSCAVIGWATSRGTLAPGGVAWGPVRLEVWRGGEEQRRGGRRGSEEAEERAERRGVLSHARRKKQARGVNWAQGRRPADSTVRDGKQRRR